MYLYINRHIKGIISRDWNRLTMSWLIKRRIRRRLPEKNSNQLFLYLFYLYFFKFFSCIAKRSSLSLLTPPRPLPTPPRPLLTPPRRLLTPPRPLLTPPRHLLTPPRPLLTPPRHLLTPPRPLLTPPRPQILCSYWITHFSELHESFWKPARAYLTSFWISQICFTWTIEKPAVLRRQFWKLAKANLAGSLWV